MAAGTGVVEEDGVRRIWIVGEKKGREREEREEWVSILNYFSIFYLI